MAEDRSALEKVADAAVYAPLGLALEASRLFPEMADRGRRQVTFNWMVGRYAVRRARARTDETVATVMGTAEGLLDLAGIRLPWAGEADPAPPEAEATSEPVADAQDEQAEPSPAANGSTAPLTAVADPPAADAPDPDDLAIPGYDSLSAFQVVPRLEDLGGDELEAVRQYEHATRGRRTILSRIAQLQAS
jgi:hypothetical protein